MKTKNRGLIVLCWLIYTCSYIGKIGYSANIIRIENNYNITHATAGMVSTFFFFAYGCGQILNGIFCKKYNLKWIIFGSLLLSGICNLLMGILSTFALQKYVWLVNGISLSVLWPSLMRCLSERLNEKEIPKAVVAMGTTVAVGTVLVYGLSALFVEFFFYQLIFYVAAGLLPLFGTIWLVSIDRYRVIERPVTEGERIPQTVKRDKAFWITAVVLAIFAIVVNLVKDGLTTWVPGILKEVYLLSDSLSVLLTLLLPILAIFGTSVATWLRKKISDFVGICVLLFFLCSLLIGGVLVFLSTSAVITLISFSFVSCLMAGINNVITSMIPLYWKDKVNSGLFAGILNGFCYVGSALSSFALGFVADQCGWDTMFVLLLCMCVSCALIGIIGIKLSPKRQSK